mmetsp:Transcript_28819/g.46626  ORF Transcript_28819/g.46626 Transcript_28819/m.46626 type:complete len:644 (-) Transcript_28819:173-2104(-)
MGRRRRLVFFGLSVIIILFSISAISTHTRTSSAKTNQSRLQALQLVTKKRTPSDRVTFSLLTTIRDFDEWHFEQASGSEHRVFAEQYLNSFQTWTALVAPSQVVVLVELQSTCNFLQKRFPGISCVAKDCSHPEFGLPTLSCVFAHLFPFVSEDVVVWVNGDILLFDDFGRMMKEVFRPNGEFANAVVVGQRTDIELTKYMDLRTQEARDSLFREAEYGDLHGEYGIDFFAARKSAFSKFEMLPLLMGTHRWDNWLLSQYIVRKEMMVIDATNAVRVVHQGSKEKGESHHRGGADWNQQLVEEHSSKRYRLGSTSRAPYYLAKDRDGKLSVQRNDSCPCVVFAHQQALRVNHRQIWQVAMLYVQSTDEIPLVKNWLCSVRKIAFSAFFVVTESKHLRSLLVAETGLSVDQIAVTGDLAACIAEVLANQVELLVTRSTGIWLSNPFFVPSVSVVDVSTLKALNTSLAGVDNNTQINWNPINDLECSMLQVKQDKGLLPMFFLRTSSESRFLWHLIGRCIEERLTKGQKSSESSLTWDLTSDCIHTTTIHHKVTTICPFPRASTFDALTTNDSAQVRKFVSVVWGGSRKEQKQYLDSAPGARLGLALIYNPHRPKEEFARYVEDFHDRGLWILDRKGTCLSDKQT